MEGLSKADAASYFPLATLNILLPANNLALIVGSFMPIIRILLPLSSCERNSECKVVILVQYGISHAAIPYVLSSSHPLCTLKYYV